MSDLLHEDPDEYRSAGMSLLLDLLEELANGDGDPRSTFFSREDPRTGFDGIDELTDSVMAMIRFESEGHYLDGSI